MSTTVQAPAAAPSRPPTWLIVATAALTFTCLAMAVAETTLWMHYLIDQGEYISLAGLAFITVAGLYLYRQQRLLGSLPLVVPWLLYPVITQGDQLIDNLTINQMRFVCQVLLALLFGAPVAVVVLAARYALAPAAPRTLPRRHWTNYLPGLRPIAEGRVRLGSGILSAALLTAEIWVGHQFLGTLMVVTLIVMTLAALAYASAADDDTPRSRTRGEKFALAMLIAGVVVSFGLYIGYKNRPGAYQGSPAYYMDPSQKDAAYPMTAVAVPSGPAAAPAPDVAAGARRALDGYARSLQVLLDGYYIADRNYNYSFHNALFLRNTFVLPDFRRVALGKVAEARTIAGGAQAEAAAVRARLADGDPLAALLDDVGGYVAFNFRRATILEHKTAEFEKTKAGLQHATHIYEGEGKVLGVRLEDVIHKHQAAIDSPALAPIVADFLVTSRAVYDKYSNRIVGF